MIVSLRCRLEEAAGSDAIFPSAQKIGALNDAQRQVVAMCTNDVLVHLQTSRTMGSATADTDLGSLLYFALPTSSAIITDVTATAADPTVFTKTSHGLVDGDIVKLYDFTQMTEINGMTGIVNQLNTSTFEINGVAADPAETSISDDLGGTVEKLETSMTRIVSVYDDTNDRFVELVTIEGLGESTSYNYGTKGALFNNRLYVSSSTATSDCTLIYITSPTDIVASESEITYLSDSVQQAIIEMAESLLWRQDNRQNRAAVAKQSAIDIITSINSLGV